MTEKLRVRIVPAPAQTDPRFSNMKVEWSIRGRTVNLKGLAKSKTEANATIKKHVDQLNNPLRCMGKITSNMSHEAKKRKPKTKQVQIDGWTS